MTTAARVDETLARFDRKSPRDCYKQVCEETNVHMQRQIYNSLPDVAMAWHRIYTLELDNTLLGQRGCMVLLPIITVSTSMRKLSLRGCDISDEFVQALCDILMTHPSIRAVDISHNELVTVYSATAIIQLMKTNSNMVAFEIEGTHIGQNVGNIIADLGQQNSHKVMTYYEDRYFKMRNLFAYLDEDGTGWASLKAFVLNCPYPVLQEQLVERIATKNPRKKSNNTVHANTFMELVYMNYKTEKDIGEYVQHLRRSEVVSGSRIGSAAVRSISQTSAYAASLAAARKNNGIIEDPTADQADPVEAPIDLVYLFIVANWKQVIAAVERYNRHRGTDDAELQLDDGSFHRLRLRDFLLSDDAADRLIMGAIRDWEDRESPFAEPIVIDVSAEDANAAAPPQLQTQRHAAGEGGVATLHYMNLMRGLITFEQPECTRKPLYQFFRDNDVAYIPDILRNGSRLFSMRNMSLFDRSASMLSSGGSMAGGLYGTATAVDPKDPPRTFSVPPSVIATLIKFFNKTYEKLPPSVKRLIKNDNDSGIPESPRTRKDRQMDKAAIPIAAFLDLEIPMELEVLRMKLLKDFYLSNALPIEDSFITLQELVNVVDECYPIVRIDRVFTLEDIAKMENPLSKKAANSVILHRLMVEQWGIDDNEFNDAFAANSMAY